MGVLVLGCTVENKAALEKKLLCSEAGTCQRVGLLRNAHVQLVVFHTTFAYEVIANQVDTSRGQHFLHLPVKLQCIALVPQLVNRLLGNDCLKQPEALWPGGLSEAAFDKLNAC